MYEFDWGAGLGKAESVRDLKVTGEVIGTPVLPVCVILPRRPDGGLEVLILMKEAAIEMLRQDEEFSSFVEWRGM